MMKTPIHQVPYPEIFGRLDGPARYKGAYGGRGSGKSHYFATAAVSRCLRCPGTRVVCVREVQRSLKESVKRLIEDKIEALGVGDSFGILSDRIIAPDGGVILFQGMKDHTAESIKSLEGFDVGYVADTGIAPNAALKTLLGLAATGEASDRIAAARALEFVLDTDPTVWDRVPPPLAKHATLMVQLADTSSIPHDKIIEAGDRLIRDLSPGIEKDQPDPGLTLLASGQTDAATQIDGQSGASGEGEAVPRQFRPDGRLIGPSNEAAEAARKRERNIDRGGDNIASLDQPRLSGSVREALDSAEVSARDRDHAIRPKPVSEDVFMDDDELSPDFTDDELLTEEELEQFELPPIDFIDGPDSDPSRSQFGKLPFSDMTTEDLKERFAAATAGLQNQARELDKLNRKKMSAQAKEEPTRREIKKLEKELKVKIGAAGVASLVDFVSKRVLAPTVFVDLAKAILGEVEISSKEKVLDAAFGKTKKVEAKEKAQRINVMIWLTEQRNIEAELKKRENEKRQ
jgi:hypothetical protein